MKIGIITPSYNQGCFLGSTIESVIGQSRSVDYYAIYDSCSGDETADVLRQHATNPKISAIIIEKDKGQSDAINRGFRNLPADIDIMGYLNSDDVLAPDCVETVMGLFEKHPEVDLITGWRRIMGPRGRLGITSPSYPRSRDDIVLNVGIHQETTFWRRSLYERAGGYVDTSFKFAMDYDLWLRMSEANWHPLYLKKVLGYFRIHGLSKSSTLMATTSVQELNRLRESRGYPTLSEKQFIKQVKQLEAREKGGLGFFIWRIKSLLLRRVLLPYYL